MSREQTKEWNQIGTITENWVKASYPKADAQSAWKYKDRMNRFLEFIGMTDAEFWRIAGSVLAGNLVGQITKHLWLKNMDSLLAKTTLAILLGGVYSRVDPINREPDEMSPTAAAGYITGMHGFTEKD